MPNRPFADSHSRVTKPPRWRAKVALGQDKQKTYVIWNGNFLCLSCPSATFPFQHGGFVPREWLAAEGPLRFTFRQNGRRNSQKALRGPFPLQWRRFLRGRDGSFQVVWRTELKVYFERTHNYCVGCWPYIYAEWLSKYSTRWCSLM